MPERKYVIIIKQAVKLGRENEFIPFRRNKEISLMKASFYDVKERKKIEAEVTRKVKYGKPSNERHAFRAKTSDGRNLTRFVSKAEWEKAKV